MLWLGLGMGFSLGLSDLVCPIKPWKQILNSRSLHRHFPCLKEEKQSLLPVTWWPLLPCMVQPACSLMGQKGKRLRILHFCLRTTTIGKRKWLLNVASQFNHHSTAGLEQREDIHLTAKIPANALRAFSEICFNILNKLGAVISCAMLWNFILNTSFPLFTRERPRVKVCLKLQTSLWFLQVTHTKNAALCARVQHQILGDYTVCGLSQTESLS